VNKILFAVTFLFYSRHEEMSNPMKPTVLVVEDDKTDAQLLDNALHKFTHLNVRTVSDSTEALAYLEGEEDFADRKYFPFPSLLVLDMHLPYHSGPRILKWMRETNVPRPILIIILSKVNLAKVPGQIMEKHGNVTICFAPFLKPDTDEMARIILDLFERWRVVPLQRK
jgi:CheY-like chemotaxis protein